MAAAASLNLHHCARRSYQPHTPSPLGQYAWGGCLVRTEATAPCRLLLLQLLLLLLLYDASNRNSNVLLHPSSPSCSSSSSTLTPPPSAPPSLPLLVVGPKKWRVPKPKNAFQRSRACFPQVPLSDWRDSGKLQKGAQGGWERGERRVSEG